jgi:hypothetical protein
MTIVQLLAAQRERELREQGKPGTWSWIELPFVCILCVCILLFVCVNIIANGILAMVRNPAKPMPHDTRGHD